MDLAERFFARQNPEFSALIRAQLRTAPDQDAVVSIAQTLLLQLEAVAGSERAEGIRERLDRLWPIQELNSEIK